MTRPPRLQIADSITHVMYRGVDGQPIYIDEIDRRFELALLALGSVRYDVPVIAWCQLSNHGHLLVRTPKPNLSAFVQYVTGRYAQVFNERHARKGHLYERRFKSVLIETEPHLLEVFRYIPLNPPHAGLCELPEDWPWSSYRATIGLASAPPWLAVDEILKRFGRDAETARRRYREFVLDRLYVPAPATAGV